MKRTNKLSTRDFAEYLACSWVLLRVSEISIDESFHATFVKTYNNLLMRLPDEFKPDFKITINPETKISSTLQVIINKIVIHNGDLAWFQCLSQKVLKFRTNQKNLAREKLRKLPLEINSFFERIAYACAHP